MMYPIEPEDDYLFPPVDWDELYTEETFGDRLKLFYNQFKSNTRPLLDDCLFRETVGVGGIPLDSATLFAHLPQQKEKLAAGVVTGLEILCGSEIVYKRLVQKNQKIGNEIRWIWPETVTRFKIGFHTPTWFGQTFQLQKYWLK
jgi:hypothetical protein